MYGNDRVLTASTHRLRVIKFSEDTCSTEAERCIIKQASKESSEATSHSGKLLFENRVQYTAFQRWQSQDDLILEGVQFQYGFVKIIIGGPSRFELNLNVDRRYKPRRLLNSLAMLIQRSRMMMWPCQEYGGAQPCSCSRQCLRTPQFPISSTYSRNSKTTRPPNPTLRDKRRVITHSPPYSSRAGRKVDNPCIPYGRIALRARIRFFDDQSIIREFLDATRPPLLTSTPRHEEIFPCKPRSSALSSKIDFRLSTESAKHSLQHELKFAIRDSDIVSPSQKHSRRISQVFDEIKPISPQIHSTCRIWGMFL